LTTTLAGRVAALPTVTITLKTLKPPA